MSRAAHLHEQAARFRELAKTERSETVRERLVALAAQCEQLAISIDGGNAKSPRSDGSGAAPSPAAPAVAGITKN